MIFVTSEPLDPEVLTAFVRNQANGAVVTFLGTARRYTGTKQVHHLDYEAYVPMAEAKLNEIAEEIHACWDIKDICIAHRIGRIEIGEISLVVAIGSPHRQTAFNAIQYAVERLKKTVPIWKKEVFMDGAVWVGSP